ncbi:MAG: hypothetical protein ACI87E_004715 [Mariniblastus sp.]|jgi:hypothetical protein
MEDTMGETTNAKLIILTILLIEIIGCGNSQNPPNAALFDRR